MSTRVAKSRPHDVTVVCVVMFFVGAMSILIGLSLSLTYSPLLALIFVLAGIANFVVGSALCAMKRWARRAAQITVVVGGIMSVLGIILVVLALHRLGKPEVRKAFGEKPIPEWQEVAKRRERGPCEVCGKHAILHDARGKRVCYECYKEIMGQG